MPLLSYDDTPTRFSGLWMKALVPTSYAMIDQKSWAGVSAGMRMRVRVLP